MKKLLILCICAVFGLSATAQQLPNAGFEDWKTACGSSEAFGSGSNTSPATGEFRVRPGEEPQDWNGSSVNQKVILNKTETLVSKVDYNNGKVLKLENKFVGVAGMGAVAPGFVNFGTPWVYAIATVSKCDGGTYGGLDFNYRPDELQLDINRVDENEEVSSIIAYFWKGVFKSKVGEAGAPTQVRTDVDRAIMGKVTPDEAGQLLASIDETITTTNGDWATLNYKINWKNEEQPTKMNVIICSGDYWNRSNMVDKTNVLVDNIKFIYYSRLNSLSVGENEVTLEEGKYDYSFDFVMPDNDEAFVYEVKGASATAAIIRDEANHTATIKVTNVDADIDGQKEHNYVLAFAAPAAPVESEKYDGNVTISIPGADPVVETATIYIEMTGENTCTFRLPNFAFSGIPMGDIVVENVTITENNGVKTYTGAVEDLILKSPLLGDIHAGVTLNGTIDAQGNVNMNIPVIWYQDGNVNNTDPDNATPIGVVFTNSKTPTGIENIEAENAPVEYYNLQGVRVANPENGIYIRRQGNKVTKVIVK